MAAGSWRRGRPRRFFKAPSIPTLVAAPLRAAPRHRRQAAPPGHSRPAPRSTQFANRLQVPTPLSVCRRTLPGRGTAPRCGRSQPCGAVLGEDAQRCRASAMTASAPEAPLVAVESVSKHFPQRGSLLRKSVLKAVDNVSFTIAKGETLGLVGNPAPANRRSDASSSTCRL